MNLTSTNKTLLTECFANKSSDYLQAHSENLTRIYKVYYGWISLPVVFLGFIFTLIYIAAVYRAIKLRRVSRKCYVLLLNRAVGDVLGCVVGIGIVSYALIVEHISKDLMQLLDVFFIGTFWSAMVSYVSLSMLKLYAIARPLQYRNNITIRRFFSWIVLVILTLYSLTTTALVKIPFLNQWSGCRIETCLRTMYRLRNVFLVVVYFITIICFLLTAHQSGKSFHQKSSNGPTPKKKHFMTRFPLWKLALNVGTFGVFNIFYVSFAIFMLINKDKCFFLHNYAIMFRLLGLIRFSLFLRIVVDPVLSFIRRSALALFGISRRILPFSNTRNTTESNETNSSEMGTISPTNKLSAVSAKSLQIKSKQSY